MKVREIEAPAALLPAAVLPYKAIEPTLQSSRQFEIRAVNGQHERLVEDTGVEPVGQDELQTTGMTEGIGRLFPFVDPGEAVSPALEGLTDRRHHGGRLQ